MKYAICNETFQHWDWAETCHKVAELGYDGIEIAPFTLAEDIRGVSPHARHVYKNTAQRAGLEVVGLHWLLVSPKGLSLTSPDASVRSETADYLAALADFCADMGGKIMVLGSPAQRRLPEEGVSVAQERLEAALQPVLSRCQRHGVTLCLEPLPPPEADFLLTLAEAMAAARRIGHPNLRTIFDVKSTSSEGTPLPELIRAFAPDIAHVHANDANRRGPGFGETDYVPIFAALKEVGYAGYVSVEVFDYTPDPVTIAQNSLAYMRQCAT